jgi:hypothetical protein
MSPAISAIIPRPLRRGNPPQFQLPISASPHYQWQFGQWDPPNYQLGPATERPMGIRNSRHNRVSGNSNCNPAIGPIGVRAPPLCIMNQKFEMGPKSETWTRKLNSGGAIVYSYAVICPIATGHGGIRQAYRRWPAPVDSERFRAVPRICGRFRSILSLL